MQLLKTIKKNFALVQEQKFLDFLPYPPNALINAIRANYETQCSLLYYSRNFSFPAIFPYFFHFLHPIPTEQCRNWSNQGKGLEVMSCQCRSDEDHI